MKKLAFTSLGIALAAPMLAFAQRPDFGYANRVVEQGTVWLQTAVTVIMVLITIFFLYSVLRYVMEKDPGKLADRRKTMIAGIIGVFVAVSIWGIVRVFQRTAGVDVFNSLDVNMVCPPGQIPRGGTCQP